MLDLLQNFKICRFVFNGTYLCFAKFQKLIELKSPLKNIVIKSDMDLLTVF